ncbi:MAG: DUF481 domain-containing protein [Pseudomonadota bacterium]
MVRHSFTLPIVVVACLLSAAAHAEKTDEVELVNGNLVTGEVKSLEFGALRYSTDSMGTVTIDWEDVVTVRSKQDLQIELADGTRYFGELLEPSDQYRVRIKTRTREEEVSAQRVVRITPIEVSESFLERLDGAFSFGFQTQKSSSVSTLNVSGDVSYRAREYLVGLRLNSAITDQPSEPTTARQSLSTNYQRFRPNRWFTDWFTTLEQNDELGIVSRFSAGGALGRYFIQTNQNQLSLAAGLQGARSKFVGEDDDTTEAEGRIEFRYLHRSLTPEATFNFTALVFPLLDDLSQYRAESDLSLRREIVEDLFLEVGVGFSYLSDPPTGAANSDYTATTSIGYSF